MNSLGRSARDRCLPSSFYARPAEQVARELLGCCLVRELDGELLKVRIVETEAYLGASDRASHAWGDRRTKRTASLFRDGGRAYVYLIYGLHNMLNVVTGSSSDGSAVLLRGAEPIEGGARMAQLRGIGHAPRDGAIAGGPGRLCQALGVDRSFDGADLTSGLLRITERTPGESLEIQVGPRVGIDYAEEAVDWPLRFGVAGNSHVSQPRL